MSYQVLARRWRPLTFASVVGQKHITATLANAIERDRVAHAFLFTGTRGVGKTTVARLLARALNCTQRDGAEPCNKCPSCEGALSGSSVDVMEIDGASNRGIDEVRDIIAAARYLPASSRFKIYIIDEVHQLTTPAFNALLKLLEEPPAHVKFIMATTEAHRLPQTVLSRCQRYDFRRIIRDEISSHLVLMAKDEGVEVGEDAVALIAREADGSMRDAQSLLEQVLAGADGPVGADQAAELLGLVGRQAVADTVRAVVTGDAARVVEIVADLDAVGADPERFLAEVLGLLRHVAVAQAAGPDSLGPSAVAADKETARDLADKRSRLDVQRIFGLLLATAEDLKRGSQPELVLEMGLLKAASLDKVESAAEILKFLQSSGGGASGPSPAAVAAPKAAPPRTAGGSVAPPSAPATAEDGSGENAQWERVLDAVRKRLGVNVYVTLSNCEFVYSDQDQLVQLRPLSSNFSQVLDVAETIEALKEIVAEQFGAGTGLEVISHTKTASNGVSMHDIEKQRAAKMKEETLKDPLVSEALDVLGGKIDSISPLDD
ncbi:MAG: DNA polymerase III subunit gamma/tau [Deltaproteobacteria bacterium]